MINQLARFAVPFFFILSGYFWGVKVNNGGSEITLAFHASKRLFILWIGWSLIYLLPYNIGTIYDAGLWGPIHYLNESIHQLLLHPIRFFFSGSKVHLWFIVSLFFSYLICAFFVYKKWLKSLVFLAFIFYFIGIIAKSYSDTPLGVNIHFNTRNGPFFSVIFFVSGYLLSQYSPRTQWFMQGACLFFIGCCFHFSEIYMLWHFFGTPLMQDYVFGTYFMGLGVAIMSLSNHSLLQNQWLSKIGRMTLGIYAVHFIYVDILKVIEKRIDSVFWEVGYVFIVFFLSLFTTLLFSKMKITKKLVI
jgi:surface polysaccharide O-acyltransferase-like enzyme